MQIGSIHLKNNLALAPMAGLTDVPFRTLIWDLGAGYMVSEMVSSKPELWETGKSRLRRQPVPGATPVAVQIAGSDPVVMADAARRHADDGVDVIDINFGCPAKKVCRKAAGSALLGDIRAVGRIVERVASAVALPVTVKTRVGLTLRDDAGCEAARVAQSAGAQMIVVHGRSRACHFRGEASYERVHSIKQSVGIPVMVNGDIDSADRLRRALEVSGADGAMIGRGAIGKPWIFAELTGRAPLTRAAKWRVIRRHLELSERFYGGPTSARMMRKHLKAYLLGLGYGEAVGPCLQLTTSALQIEFIARLADADDKDGGTCLKSSGRS